MAKSTSFFWHFCCPYATLSSSDALLWHGSNKRLHDAANVLRGESNHLMPTMRFVLMKNNDQVFFVEMPDTHAYQLSALNLRLHKELDKLTAEQVPALPYAIAECDRVELHDSSIRIASGLDYINELEREFAAVKESAYPLIALLTEIRALQAQLEQWYEDEIG